jgi:hypothetical protein
VSVLGDVEKLKQEVARLQHELELQKAINARREEQISGDRGLSATITASNNELKALIAANNHELKEKLAASNNELKEKLDNSSMETKSVKKTLYSVGFLIVAGSIGMAFAALQIAGGG